MSVPQAVWTGDSTFGECPVWLPRSSALYWLDIDSGLLRSYSGATGLVKEWNVGIQSAGLTPSENGDSLIIGRGGLLRRFDPVAGALTAFDEIPAMDIEERVNDLATDPSGALWVATMDRAGVRPSGRLLRRTQSGDWMTALRQVPIVNGPAFDHVRGLGYVCDSAGRRVLRFALPLIGSSVCDAPSPFIEFTPQDGFPDGITVNSDGDLWVAHYGGGRVTRFTPDGVVAQVIVVPAVNVTSVAVGDDTLYITTARHTPTRGAANGGALYAMALSSGSRHAAPRSN